MYINFLDNTLKVLEACVKNCGAPMHKEVATKEIMDFFRELAKVGIRRKSVKNNIWIKHQWIIIFFFTI